VDFAIPELCFSQNIEPDRWSKFEVRNERVPAWKR
jgi:hypothetical protein